MKTAAKKKIETRYKGNGIWEVSNIPKTRGQVLYLKNKSTTKQELRKVKYIGTKTSWLIIEELEKVGFKFKKEQDLTKT